MRWPLTALLITTVLWTDGCSSGSIEGKKYIHGCLVTISTRTRTALYESLVIVGINPAKDEYWVYFPERDQEEFTDAKGNVRAANIPMWKVLKNGEARIIEGIMCRCPGNRNVMER